MKKQKLITIFDIKKVFCGCYYCLNTFLFSDIKEFLTFDDVALCPKCKIDSVIGSELPIDDQELIELEHVMFGLHDALVWW